MKKIPFIALCLMLAIGLTSCSDMYDSIEQYTKSGEIIYPYPYNGDILPGNQRVKFQWKLPVNHTVVKMKAFWNDGLDSLELPLKPIEESGREFEYILDGLVENNYLFSVYSYDEQQNKSIAFEKTVNVFGPIYKEILSNREYIDIIKSDEQTVLIIWDTPKSEDVGVEVEYTDLTQEIKTAQLLIDDTVSPNEEGGRARAQESFIENIDVSKPVRYRTFFRPEERTAFEILVMEWSNSISIN